MEPVIYQRLVDNTDKPVRMFVWEGTAEQWLHSEHQEEAGWRVQTRQVDGVVRVRCYRLQMSYDTVGTTKFWDEIDAQDHALKKRAEILKANLAKQTHREFKGFELQFCPDCGGDETLAMSLYSHLWIRCENPGCCFSLDTFEQLDAIIAQWQALCDWIRDEAGQAVKVSTTEYFAKRELKEWTSLRKWLAQRNEPPGGSSRRCKPKAKRKALAK